MRLPKVSTILTAMISTFVVVSLLSRIPPAKKFMLNE